MTRNDVASAITSILEGTPEGLHFRTTTICDRLAAEGIRAKSATVIDKLLSLPSVERINSTTWVKVSVPTLQPTIDKAKLQDLLGNIVFESRESLRLSREIDKQLDVLDKQQGLVAKRLTFLNNQIERLISMVEHDEVEA